MNPSKLLIMLFLVLGVIVCPYSFCTAAPMGTAFTYQGRLIDANNAADGSYDFQLRLFDDPGAGTQKGNAISIGEAVVIDGYFTLQLDFGSVFDGNERWLEIGVRPGDLSDPNGYIILSPRQQLTPTPYAMYANNTGYAQTTGGITGSGTTNQIAKFTGPNTISNSVIHEQNSNVGIGKTPGSYALDVSGNVNAAAYYGDGSFLTGIQISDSSISQTKLKTATGEVYSYNASATGYLLSGGEYAFLATYRGNPNHVYMGLGCWNNNIAAGYLSTSEYRGPFVTCDTPSGRWCYIKTRYVTSSGSDHWLFLLVDKATKDIVGAYSAPDHPAYGNGGDFNKITHPFRDYDPNTQEIVLIDNSTIAELKAQITPEKSLLALVNEEYKLKTDKEEVYQPLHSGKFLTEGGEQVKQMVQGIPSYIKVRKLEKLTEQDKQHREISKQQKMQKMEQDKQKKDQDKQNAINKLKALGLNEAEVFALIKK